MTCMGPTIKCKYCEKMADKVCINPNCEEYPFLCDEKSECLFKQGNVAYKFHQKCLESNGHCLLSIRQLRERVSSIESNFSQKHLQNVQKWKKKIIRKIEKFVDEHEETVTEKYTPRLKPNLESIKNRLIKPSNCPDLKSSQLHHLLKSADIFDEDDSNYKSIKQLQQHFDSFSSYVSITVDNFYEQYYKILSSKDQTQRYQQNPYHQLNQSENNKIDEKQNAVPQQSKRQLKVQHIDLSSDSEQQILNDVQNKEQQFTIKKESHHQQTLIQECLNKAKKLYQNDQSQRAVQVLKKAVSEGYADWKIYLNIGEYSYISTDNLDTLDYYYNKSIQLFPNPEAFNGRGIVLTWRQKETNYLKHLQKSIQYFETALKYRKDSVYYYNRGISQYKLSRYQDGINSFTEALNLQNKKPQKAECYYCRGECYYQLNRYRQAKSDYSTAYELNPSDKKYSDAFKYFKDTKNKNPQNMNMKHTKPKMGTPNKNKFKNNPMKNWEYK